MNKAELIEAIAATSASLLVLVISTHALLNPSLYATRGEFNQTLAISALLISSCTSIISGFFLVRIATKIKRGGTVTVKIEKNKFKKAEINNSGDVDVRIINPDPDL